jgi:allantoicase
MTDFTDLIDLASERLGSAVIDANDEFFAPKEGLIKPGKPEWREGVYTERGKWMDGWETRRRRSPGHDWAIVRLGVPGVVRGVVIDTSFYTGNYPDQASIEACSLPGLPSPDELASNRARWRQLLQPVALKGDAPNQFAIDDDDRVTHLRLNIYPDGGVARLRVYGEVKPDPRALLGDSVDLAAMANGGYVELCSDMHYGHRQNIILPGRSTHMGDGWETKRRRGLGNDWTIVRLAGRGLIDRIEVDTDHYKGNAPGACSVECAEVNASALGDPRNVSWTEIVQQSPLQPHARHQFDTGARPAATHVRLNIYPDGGIARMRVIGRVVGDQVVSGRPTLVAVK